ncbi:MAG: Cro/C1-type DNA-binding domain [Blastocatellia bacterium]|jgi:transcriptional regulator with XRE-family HTH domain|nr:Cro/C1-type DNA-binding domain [Blastocatellia bacterium]
MAIQLYGNELIKGAMAEQELTVADVAEITGLSPTTISFVRNGKENVKLPTLKKIADALDLQLIVRFEKREAARA